MQRDSLFSAETLATTYMRHALVSAVLLLAFLSLDFFSAAALQIKETPANATAAAAPPRNSSGTRAAEAVARNLVLAWNRGDAGGIARMFVPNGELIISGSVIRSRGAIEKRIREEQSGRLKESLLRNTIEHVSFPDANTALVRGKYVLDGMKLMGIKTSPGGSYVLRQKRQQGHWLIEKAEVTKGE